LFGFHPISAIGFYKLSIYDVTTLISSICQKINVSSHNFLKLLKKKPLLGLLHININLGRHYTIINLVRVR